MIILFYGQPASGKTTLADKLKKTKFFEYKSIRIDGDKWRDVTKNKDYSKEGRIKNLKGAFDMALYLEKEGYTPILSFVTPYEELRNYLKDNSEKAITIYLKYNEDRGRNNFFVNDFEENDECNIVLNTSSFDTVDCLNNIFNYLLNTNL